MQTRVRLRLRSHVHTYISVKLRQLIPYLVKNNKAYMCIEMGDFEGKDSM